MNQNQQLKQAYGLENLEFYMEKGKYHCKYVSDVAQIKDRIDIFDLDACLKFLSMNQCHVFFDDIGEICIGIDGLKEKYLIFKIANL